MTKNSGCSSRASSRNLQNAAQLTETYSDTLGLISGVSSYSKCTLTFWHYARIFSNPQLFRMSPVRHDGNHLMNSKEQNPSWQSNRSAASQEISSIWQKLTVRYRMQKDSPLAPVPSQINPIQITSYHFLSSALILYSHPRLASPTRNIPSVYFSLLLHVSVCVRPSSGTFLVNWDTKLMIC